MEKEFKVTFLPGRRHVYAIKGSSVFEAASRAGILIQAPCGGEGRCGKCRVKLVKGRLAPRTEKEKAVLEPEEIEEGIRLACQAVVAAACTIDVPEASRVCAGNILVSGRLKSVKPDPGIKKTFLRLGKPGRGDHASLSCMVMSKAGCSDADVSALRMISEAGTAPEGITAVCSGKKLASVERGDTVSSSYGIALDLGTTTLAASLIDLSSGRELAVASRLNPQSRFGDDLITRIHFATKSGRNLKIISSAVISAVNDMLVELKKTSGVPGRYIYKLTVAGNTVMQHIFCGISPAALGEMPFVPVTRKPVRMTPADSGLDLAPCGEVFVFPSIGGFVGGDAVAAALASGIASSKKKRILVDIGTNGEIIAGNSEKLLCASAAAGPAFESARISMGMIASPGAIEKVIINEDVHINVIGNIPPLGICGSGLLDAAAQLLEAGIIDRSGRILRAEELPDRARGAFSGRAVNHNGESAFILSGEGNHRQVYITQRDIRELQLAKSAIYSGIRILKRRLGIRLCDIEEILVAGAFGNFIRRSSAKRIGLIPGIPSNRIKFIGNASSSGAKLLLLSKDVEKEAVRIADSIKHVELASSVHFQQEFAEHMLFPE